MYYVEYLTGNFLLGREGIDDIEMTVEWFSTNIGDIFVPLYVGAAFYSIVVTGIIYVLLNRLWIRSVHSEKHERKTTRNQKETSDKK